MSVDDVPKVLSVATAVPGYKISQRALSEVAAGLFGGGAGAFPKLAQIYDNAAISTRYSCVPPEWYERPCPFSEHNRLYVENAVSLLAEAAQKAVDRAHLSLADIDGLVIVSSSG